MSARLAQLACSLGLGAFLRWRNRHQLLVLMYHGVVEQALEPFCWHQLPLDAFRRQMAWVAKRYVVLPLDQALALRAEGRLPARACAITFDDGYENVATHALPVLDALRLPATVFVVTDLVGGTMPPWPDRLWLAVSNAPTLDAAAKAAFLDAWLPRLKAMPRAEKDAALADLLDTLGAPGSAAGTPFAMLDWPTIERLAAEGLIAFGPHSTTHEILSRCEDAEVERQVTGSTATVAERLGRGMATFAYPNGRAIDFDERTKRAVAKAGCRHALSTVEGLVGADADPLALPRVAVGADLAFARFQLLCAGL